MSPRTSLLLRIFCILPINNSILELARVFFFLAFAFVFVLLCCYCFAGNHRILTEHRLQSPDPREGWHLWNWFSARDWGGAVVKPRPPPSGWWLRHRYSASLGFCWALCPHSGFSQQWTYMDLLYRAFWKNDREHLVVYSASMEGQVSRGWRLLRFSGNS